MRQEDVNELVARGNVAMGRDGFRVWCVHWSDPDHGLMQEWFESEAEAEMVWRLKGEEASARLESVEIPKTRRDLVRWLNLHFNTDNG